MPISCILYLHTGVGTQMIMFLLLQYAQPIMNIHGDVICHMNGNFVSFQNMCEFKRSDL